MSTIAAMRPAPESTTGAAVSLVDVRRTYAGTPPVEALRGISFTLLHGSLTAGTFRDRLAVTWAGLTGRV